MKHALYLILLFFLSIASSSCSKNFLEVKDNSFLNRQGYVKDLTTLQDFLNGIYVMIPNGFEDYTSVAYPDLIADNLKLTSEGSPAALHYNWSQRPGDVLAANATSMNGRWQECYKIVRACNFVIEEASQYTDENAAKAHDMQGQAYALRALVHFRLVNIFAQTYVFSAGASHPGVPYITTSDITQPYTRKTVTDVYDMLVEDLKRASTLMPTITTDCRFMNSLAAKALLAKVYLFKEDFPAAQKLSIEITSQVPLMQIFDGYPNDLFKNKAPSQTEILFQATPVQAFLGYVLEDQFWYAATNDLGKILQENPNDARKIWVRDTLNGQFKVAKFPQGVANGLFPAPSGDYYSPIIRASDTYLIAAEASAKTGNENTARDYLNAIRKRADPTISDITATGKSLLDSIYKERRRELCFEGGRMYDLQRWKLGVHRADVYPGYQVTLPYPSNKAIAPIPGQDVNLMGIGQNEGY